MRESWSDRVIRQGAWSEPNPDEVIPNVEGGLEIIPLKKKKVGYTILEILAMFEQITNILGNPQKYGNKTGVTSHLLWDSAEREGLLPYRTSESMRGFIKQNKNLTINEVLAKLKN